MSSLIAVPNFQIVNKQCNICKGKFKNDWLTAHDQTQHTNSIKHKKALKKLRKQIDDLIDQRNRNKESDQIRSETIYNIGCNKKHESTYIPHLKLQDAFKLKIHDLIDHRDEFGVFALATITHKHGTILKIHYEGYDDKWDAWSDFEKELHRFADPFSISQRPAHRLQGLKCGEFVDVNPGWMHSRISGWRQGKIMGHRQGSGQVLVSYMYDGKSRLYWTHLDNTAEIASYYSMSR
eukprot:495828_1